MRFSQTLRQAADPWWAGSFQHPFITKMVDGTLPAANFRYYLLQDNYYLKHFVKLHQLTADQSTDPVMKALMLESVDCLHAGELAVRQTFFQELGITAAEIEETAIAPTAYNYVAHMYRQLIEHSPEAAFVGLLPCHWLYQEIGQRLIAQGSPNDLYQRWIETYATDDLAHRVDESIVLLDKIGENSTAQQRQVLIDAFIISSYEEYHFWTMGMTFEKFEQPQLKAQVIK